MANKSDLGLLLLHALPFDSGMWAQQMSVLPHRTVAPDLYGFGADIGRWAEQALALIDAQRLVVVGCSVGGSCALEIAARAPDRIAALVLIGTKARCVRDDAGLSRHLACLEKHGVEAAWQTLWEPLFQSANDSRFARQAKALALRQSTQYLANGITAFHTRPSRDRFVAKSDFPIHVVSGDQDPLPGPQACRALAASTPNGMFHLFRGSGHYLPIVASQQLNLLLARIIRARSDEFQCTGDT